MPVLKTLKRGTLRVLKNAGLFWLARNSEWRRQRLLILCYHGVSIDDEHRWDWAYYISAELFEQRLRMLRDGGYTVLPLGEAVERLYARTLPPRSVVLTFDDGLADFNLRARPLLKQYGFPATVYLSTYYCLYNKPVFPMFCDYVLWKGRERGRVAAAAVLGDGATTTWDLSTREGRADAKREMLRHAIDRDLSAEERDQLAQRLARALGVDYDALVAKRILHLMTPDEVSELSRAGVDFQLHTHRHRTPTERGLFVREIVENRRHIATLAGGESAHFCYPSGVTRPEFLPWLAESGVVSATTCETGLATPDSAALLLPRVIDTGNLDAVEFEGWLAGIAALLPRRHYEAVEA